MPQLPTITITEEQLVKIRVVLDHGKYSLSSFIQLVLNDYFEGKNNTVGKDFMLYMGFPLIISVLCLVFFFESQYIWVFYLGLIVLGLSIASTYYVLTKYRDSLKGK